MFSFRKAAASAAFVLLICGLLQAAAGEVEFIEMRIQDYQRKMDQLRMESIAAQAKLNSRNLLPAEGDAAEKQSNEIAIQLKHYSQILDELNRALQDKKAQHPDAIPPDGDEWRAKVEKALDTKVSFEFADVRLEEALRFLRQLAGVNVILDPRAADAGGSISLKLQDMPLRDALKWICKLSGTQYEIRNQAVFIMPEQPERAVPELAPRTPAAPYQSTRVFASGSKVHVKLSNGTEIEADGMVLNDVPELLEDILSQLQDTSKDGVLVYRIEDEKRAALAEQAKSVVAAIAPGVVGNYNKDLHLLVVTGDSPALLRRADVVLRAILYPPKPPAKGETFKRVDGAIEMKNAVIKQGYAPTTPPVILPPPVLPPQEARTPAVRKGKGVEPPHPPDTAKDNF